MRQLLLLPIRFYQYAVSPLMASHCRHYPTCSQYAIEAIQFHGPVKGSYLATLRLLRCHPWAEGGYDPVPGTTQPTDGTGSEHETSEDSASTYQIRH